VVTAATKKDLLGQATAAENVAIANVTTITEAIAALEVTRVAANGTKVAATAAKGDAN